MPPAGDATLVRVTDETPIHEQHDVRCAYRALYDPTSEETGGWVGYRAIVAYAGRGWATPDPDWLAGLDALVAAGYAERRDDRERDYVSAWRLTAQGSILHARFGVG